jgi:hypothetical protein
MLTPEEIRQKVLEQHGEKHLRVLDLRIAGKSSPQVVTILGREGVEISEGTIWTYQRDIYNTLGVKDFDEVRAAMRGETNSVGEPEQPRRSWVKFAVIGLAVFALLCIGSLFLFRNRSAVEPTEQVQPTALPANTRSPGVRLDNYYFSFNEYRSSGAGGGTLGFVTDFSIVNENRDQLLVDFNRGNVTITDNFGENPSCDLYTFWGSGVARTERVTTNLKRGESIRFSVGCYPGQNLPSDVLSLVVSLDTRISNLEMQTFEYEAPR